MPQHQMLHHQQPRTNSLDPYRQVTSSSIPERSQERNFQGNGFDTTLSNRDWGASSREWLAPEWQYLTVGAEDQQVGHVMPDVVRRYSEQDEPTTSGVASEQAFSSDDMNIAVGMAHQNTANDCGSSQMTQAVSGAEPHLPSGNHNWRPGMNITPTLPTSPVRHYNLADGQTTYPGVNSVASPCTSRADLKQPLRTTDAYQSRHAVVKSAELQ